jgi:hypothetical protein
MPRHIVALALVVATLLAAPRVAHAKYKCSENHDRGFAFVEGFATALSVPALTVNGSDTPRRLVGVQVPGATEALVGAGLGLELRCDYILYDIVNVRYAVSLDDGLAGTASADDTTVNASRGAIQVLDVGVPLVGLPSGFQVYVDDKRDFKLSLRADLGVERVWASATVAGAGVAPSPGSIYSWNPYVRAQAALCTRLGAVIPGDGAWACLTVSPVIYDRSPFPGVSGGLRLDL